MFGMRASRKTAHVLCNVAQGWMEHVGVRHASNQAVKQRMKSVKNIEKITKAMKMVAASKMRGVQSKMEQARGFPLPFIRLLGDLPGIDVDKHLFLTLTTDRGLCGGINSTLSKYTRTLLNLTSGGEEKKLMVAIIGDKGRAQLQRDQGDQIVYTAADMAKVNLNFSVASYVAEEVLKTQYDAVRILFNRFESAIKFTPTIVTVLSPEGLEKHVDANGKLDMYELEGPDRGELLQDLAEFQLVASVFSSLLDNQTSEMGARMMAMDSSSRNAADMLEKLTLSYNRSRQAGITTELIEIISGAAALDDAK